MNAAERERLARDILAGRKGGGRNTQVVTLGSINHDKQFLPKEYTQLFYSSLWADLEPHHRLRYSQLYGLRTNEVIMLFERYLVRTILPPLVRRLDREAQPALRDLVATMLAEEAAHDEAFVALNRATRPDLYGERDFVFFPVSLEVRGLVTAMGLMARRLAHPLWLLLFAEESSLALAHDLAALGDEAEANWLAVHREHTFDERRHTLIDRLLFESCYADRGSVARRVDGWMFMYVLKAMFFPRLRGAGARVVNQLVRDFPELGPMRASMLREIVALGDNPSFLASLMSSRLSPRAWKLFHRCPELDALARFIPGYA